MKMEYLKVEWKHESDEYPVVMYSEIDDERMEIRKVEVFRNGTVGSAEKSRSSGKTELGIVAVPSVDEIASEPEFVPFAISKNEFEKVWNEYVVH